MNIQTLLTVKNTHLKKMPVKRTNKHKSKSKNKADSDFIDKKLKKKWDLIYKHGTEFFKSHISDYEDILCHPEMTHQTMVNLDSKYINYITAVAGGFDYNHYYVNKWCSWEQYGKTWKIVYADGGDKIPYRDFDFDKIRIAGFQEEMDHDLEECRLSFCSRFGIDPTLFKGDLK